ncbi:PREDICTED: signal-induced proliferation-associated 1-like protein 2 [Priapulus caudatus]|uniref:Signal-induced proliferation-associated 1-like protein 2 n=1 Tax=Priapulus caudatus TaxID=37621 RepID=A0ABM1EHV1_PRICU|nr:PREDICTED: signal-induced proliferation-associated 1-like protein 2 [Priapulus caudatus]
MVYNWARMFRVEKDVKMCLSNADHQNFFGIDENLGPVAVSIRRERVDDGSGSLSLLYQHRIIMRTSELPALRGTVVEESIPATTKPSGSRPLPVKDVLEYVVPDLQTCCLKLATSGPQTCQQLMKVDEQVMTPHYKIGIMYCKAGQSTEEEMYNNEHSGPAFDEFLETLGTKVRLKDFLKYKGGLDTKTDSTGLYSLYATYQEYEVMFHVSTMLPYSPNNKQQLLRKRHIGNDIVTIVFQEPGAHPFTPKTVRSHFQHVFIVVRAHEPNTTNVKYSVAVTRSKDVPAFGPAIPKDKLFSKSKDCAEFIIAKAINGENAAHRSEKFIAMATRTKQEYLKDLATNYVTTTSLDSGPTKFSKFSLSTKRKDKPRPKLITDAFVKGALVWQVQTEDFSQSSQLDCLLGISVEHIVLVEETSKEPIFTTRCRSVIGWTASNNSLRIYYRHGECVVIRTIDHDIVDEVKEICQRLVAVTQGVEVSQPVPYPSHSIHAASGHISPS